MKQELKNCIEQLCQDLNEAHNTIMQLQGCNNPQNYDWEEWSSQANSIRWAEKLLDKKLSKLAHSEKPKNKKLDCPELEPNSMSIGQRMANQ